jgi:tetratricopeptide (TPR) repeat protein
MTRKKHKQGNKQSLAKFKKGGEKLHVSSYTITYDPLKNKDENLPKPDKDRLQDLYEMLRGNPKQVIEELLVLKENHPNVPRLYNFLSAAYEAIGDRAAAREIVIENYQQNPDYLFAKLNYAQICMMDGDAEKIPDIFDGKFDLKLLYPNRNCFHVTEFAGFTGVTCAYFAATGKQEIAQLLYKSLLEVAPDSNMIEFARRFLYPSLRPSSQI